MPEEERFTIELGELEEEEEQATEQSEENEDSQTFQIEIGEVSSEEEDGNEEPQEAPPEKEPSIPEEKQIGAEEGETPPVWEPASEKDKKEEPAPQQRPQEQEDNSIGDYIADLGKAGLTAVDKSIEGVKSLSDELSDAVGLEGNVWNDELAERQWDLIYKGDKKFPRMDPESIAPQTPVGRIAEPFMRWAMGYAMGSKMLAGIGPDTSSINFVRQMFAGGLGEATVFDPYDKRLSDLMVEKVPFADQSTVLNYLKSDETDTPLEGRFKTLLDGMMGDLLAEPIFKAIKGTKKLRKVLDRAGTPDQRAKQLLAEVADDADQMADDLNKVAKNGPSSTAKKPDLGDTYKRPKPKETATVPRTAKIGEKVNALDRGNYGTIIKQNPEGTYKVRFTNPETGSTATVDLDPEMLRHMDGSPVELERVARGVKPKQLSEAELDNLVFNARANNYEFQPGEARKLLNHAYFKTGGDTHKIIREIEDILFHYKEKGIKRPRPHKETLERSYEFLSDMTGRSKEKVRYSFEGRKKPPKTVAESAQADADMMFDIEKRVTAYRVYALSLTEELNRLSRITNPTEGDIALYTNLLSDVSDLWDSIADIGTSMGRGLSAHRIKVQSILEPTPEMAQQLEENGADLLFKSVSKRIRDAHGEPQAIAKIVHGSFTQKAIGTINEVIINGMLSRPATLATNFAGNMYMGLKMPAEYIVGGAIHGARTGDWRMIEEGIQMYHGLWSSIGEANRYMRSALANDETYMNSASFISDASRTAKNFNTEYLSTQTWTGLEDSLAGDMINWAGQVVRLPGRAMRGMDEWASQLNYRARLRGKLYGEARRQGLEGDAVLDYIKAHWDENFEAVKTRSGQIMEGVRGTDIESRNYAKHGVFQDDLKTGNLRFSKHVQDAVSKNPALKPILPFLKTPANIVDETVQTSPLSVLSGNWRETVIDRGWESFSKKNWNRAKSLAIARTALGSAYAIGIYGLIKSGKITGSPPINPDKRQLYYQANIPANSIHVGKDKYGKDIWISYAKGDPLATMLSTMVDFFEMAGEVDERTFTEAGADMAKAFGSALKNKSYLKSLSELYDIMIGPEMYKGQKVQNALRMAEDIGGSAIPLSNAIFGLRQAEDPYMRETNALSPSDRDSLQLMKDVVENLKNKILFKSRELPKKWNWITGQPVMYDAGMGEANAWDYFNTMVNPFKVRKTNPLPSANPLGDDEELSKNVVEALLEVQDRIVPPRQKINGIRLTPEQYSEYTWRIGNTKINGKTLLQRLTELVRSDDWRQNDYQPEDESIGTWRGIMVNNILRAYKKKARYDLIEEHEDLYDKIKYRKYAEAYSEGGEATEAEEYEQLLQQLLGQDM